MCVHRLRGTRCRANFLDELPSFKNCVLSHKLRKTERNFIHQTEEINVTGIYNIFITSSCHSLLVWWFLGSKSTRHPIISIVKNKNTQAMKVSGKNFTQSSSLLPLLARAHYLWWENFSYNKYKTSSWKYDSYHGDTEHKLQLSFISKTNKTKKRPSTSTSSSVLSSFFF